MMVSILAMMTGNNNVDDSCGDDGDDDNDSDAMMVMLIVVMMGLMLMLMKDEAIIHCHCNGEERWKTIFSDSFNKLSVFTIYSLCIIYLTETTGNK